MKQLQNAETSSSSSTTRVRLVGFCSSKSITSTDGASPLSIAGDVISDAEIETCVGAQHEHVCVVDCTSSQSVTDRYASWLERGWLQPAAGMGKRADGEGRGAAVAHACAAERRQVREGGV